MGILDSIKNLGKKENYTVGIYLSQNSILEMVLYDNASKTIIRSARADVLFDLSTRQIDRLDIFNSTIIELLERIEAPAQTPIILSLPSVLTSKQTLPLKLSDDELKMVLTSDAERNYIFKKHEPSISWQQLRIDAKEDTQEILFSAIQSTQIDLIKEALKNYKIISIDSAYTSLLRGLAHSGVIDEQIEKSTTWALVLITPLNFIALEFQGNNIISVHDSPLAVKSINANEIYPTIINYCDENVKYENIEHLVIVNELNEILANDLGTKLDKKFKITTFEQNKFNHTPLINGEKAVYTNPENVFLETIGAACWDKSSIKIGLNFLSERGNSSSSSSAVKVIIQGKVYLITSPLIEKAFLALIILAFLSSSAIYIVLCTILGSMEKSLQDAATKKYNYENIIEKSKAQNAQQQVAPVQDLTPSVYDKNSKLIQSFQALSEVIPEKLWVEKFELNNDLTSTISGKAYSVDDIMTYFQNLVVTGAFTNLKITSIKIVGDADTSKSSDVTIVTQSQTPTLQNAPNIALNLPNLPNIPSIQSGLSALTGKRYYEFTFGTNASAAASAVTPTPATTPTPAPLPGQSSLPGTPPIKGHAGRE